MRRKHFLTVFLIVLVLCMAASSALASVTNVTGLGDGSAEVRWDSNDDGKLLFVWKTGDDYNADFTRYGYFWLKTPDDKSRMTVYDMAPGQSYWVLTENYGTGFTTPVAYDVGRAPNFNEWSNPPKMSNFGLKMRDTAGQITDIEYFLASDLENLDSYNSYGLMYRVTWPDQRKARTFLWQFVLELPDGYRYVYYQEITDLPQGGGWWWNVNYAPVEEMFHLIYQMRGEVPVGQYRFALYWNGQHACSSDFWVR